MTGTLVLFLRQSGSVAAEINVLYSAPLAKATLPMGAERHSDGAHGTTNKQLVTYTLRPLGGNDAQTFTYSQVFASTCAKCGRKSHGGPCDPTRRYVFISGSVDVITSIEEPVAIESVRRARQS